MDGKTVSDIERIMHNRNESWCLTNQGWAVADLNHFAESGASLKVYLVENGGDLYVACQDWLDIWETSRWELVVGEAQDAEEHFLSTFKNWRKLRKPIEEERRASVARDKLNRERLMQALPTYSIVQRHRVHMQLRGERYLGVRTPDETSSTQCRRIARCWNCHKFLDNYAEFECRSCGWILCPCGACGCGTVQSMHRCPMCGVKFRRSDCRVGFPYCSSQCRVNALQEYSDYLKSDAWKARRELRLAQDDYECQDCFNPATDVHHLTYERIGREDLNDLVSLCEACHLIRHGSS